MKLEDIYSATAPDTSGFVKVTSAPVIPLDKVPVGSWISGIFVRTEERQNKDKRTYVHVFTPLGGGDEFALGNTPHLKSALEKIGCSLPETPTPETKPDMTVAVGKQFSVKCLGRVAGKRYFNLEVYFGDPVSPSHSGAPSTKRK